VQDGAIMEQRGSEPAQRIAALPDVGQVLAAASLGDTVLVLGERGLYRVLLGDGSSVRLEITNSPLRFGQITVSPGNDRAIVAASVDDADARFGFRMYLGLYDQVGDAFSVLPGTPDLEQYTALQPLGFTADGTGIYVLPQGQDPSFERVVVLDVETAEIMQDLAISGEGSVALSPDARAIVTLDRAPGGSSSFVTKFYDLPAQPPESRTVPLPGSLGGISSLLWSPDSQAVYLLDGSQSAEPAATYPLWRLDVASGESRQIAVLDRTDLLVAVSSNGQWILARSSTGDTGALLDVKARASMGITVAPEAFVAGLR
jgi:hypothetical protein